MISPVFSPKNYSVGLGFELKKRNILSIITYFHGLLLKKIKEQKIEIL